MSNLQVAWLSMVVFFFVALISVIYFLFYRKSRMDLNRYKLFRERDALTSLVIKGNLREDSYVFQAFYSILNYFLRDTKALNLRELIGVYFQAPIRLIRDLSDKLNDQIEQTDAETKEAIAHIASTLNEILIQNSSILHYLVLFSSTRLFKWLPSWLKRWLFKVGVLALFRDAYVAYKQNNALHDKAVGPPAHIPA